MISAAEQLHFERVCRDILLADRDRDGIGTLNEKKLHTMLKFFVCDDKSCHEVKLPPPQSQQLQQQSKQDSKPRSFVADVLCGNDIFEIQTGALYPLRDKIGFYLEHTGYNVTVIHPLVAKKRVTYLSPVDCHVVRRVNSPKHEQPRDMIVQLYSLLPYLGDCRLRFRALMLEVEEFRIQNKRGRNGAVRYEKIPTGLIDIIDLNTPADYLPYLPSGLTNEFTAAEFGRAIGLHGIDVYSALKVFVATGLVRPEGRRGRAATYTCTPG